LTSFARLFAPSVPSALLSFPTRRSSDLAATTVLVASSLGLPISTTHTLVGGVIGVGFGHGIAALNIATVRRILTSWVATVPVARSEEHTSELQSRENLVCRLQLLKKNIY